MKTHRTGIAVGTPKRLSDLVENGWSLCTASRVSPCLTLSHRIAVAREAPEACCGRVAHRSEEARCAGYEGHDDAARELAVKKGVQGAVHGLREAAALAFLLNFHASAFPSSLISCSWRRRSAFLFARTGYLIPHEHDRRSLMCSGPPCPGISKRPS